jgi:hypothetical protein
MPRSRRGLGTQPRASTLGASNKQFALGEGLQNGSHNCRRVKIRVRD